jgi:hypothetical protein
MQAGWNRGGNFSNSSPNPEFTGYGRAAAHKTGRISLLPVEIALYTAPSHTETWL